MPGHAFKTLEDRQKIEKLWEAGHTQQEIAAAMGTAQSVISGELARGRDGTRLPNKRLRYSAELAQLRMQEAMERRGGSGKEQREKPNNQIQEVNTDPEKYCPLSMSGPGDIDLTVCIREGCGWWVADAEACAMVALAKSLKKMSKPPKDDMPYMPYHGR